MPRKARPQRTDLNATKVTVPGQDYGKQTAQAQAMTAVPMAHQAQQIAQLQQGAAKAPTPQAAPMGMPQSASPQANQPTGMPPLTPPGAPLLFDHPEDNGQHLTAGLPTGPGPGPESAGMSADQSVAAMLSKLAQGPYATPAIRSLADFAMLMGQ